MVQIKIIGKSGSSILVARDLKTYKPDTPVCIKRDGKWYWDKTLTLGAAYKFDIWEDQADTKNPVLNEIPKSAIRHLRGLDK